MIVKKTCRKCKKTVPRTRIVSHEKGARWYNVCAPCAAAVEHEELQQELKAHRERKKRREEASKKAQKAAAQSRTPEQAREKVAGVVAEFEAEEEKLSLEERAARELAVRELCRRDLLAYIQRFKPDYKAGWVHQVICHKLEQFYKNVKAGKSPRLMLFMPPRHGKSEIVSNNFPSWVLGNSPSMEIMLSSYAVTLATDFSKSNRERLRDPIYQQIFPQARVDRNAEGAEYWRTTHRGGFLAAGVGGPITGRGANIFIVDDPVKNFEEADSETVRESIKNWWRSTARTRLSPGGGVLVIQTRWHDDDLSGFLEREYLEGLKDGVPEEELEKYEIISFPAEAESEEYLDEEYNLYKSKKDVEESGVKAVLVRNPGDPLHPERYSLQYLRQTRRTMGDRLYGALYQQNPVPDSGDFFRLEDFRYYNQPPNMGPRPVYFAWDFAVSTKQSADFSVGVAGMYNERGDFIVLEVLRGRWRVAELTDRMVDLVSRYKHNAAKMGVEQGTIWEAIKDSFYAKLQARNLAVAIDHSLRPISDKRVRARPLQAWMQSGRLIFPAGQPWMEQVRTELLRFDAGVHDDVVDALAWMVRMLEDEALPDVDALRRAGDKYYINRDKFIHDYMADVKRRSKEHKRYMAG